MSLTICRGETLGSGEVFFLPLFRCLGPLHPPGGLLKESMASHMRKKVVLQDTVSLLYFQKPDKWTRDIGRAANFGGIGQAHEFARRTGQTNLDVVTAFGARNSEVHFPAWP